MLQTRTCACARRALHEPPYRTSVRAARIHPSPALATVGWAVGAVRLAAAATLEAVAARMRRTVRAAGPEDGPARLCIRPSSPQRVALVQLRQPTQRGGPLRRPCSHQLHMLQWCKEEWRGTFDGVWPKSNGGSTYLVVRICVRDRFGARGGGVDRYRRRRRRAS